MKSQNPNKLSFVLYEENFPPRYYSIGKGFLRFILYGLPTFTLLCIMLVVAGSIYFKNIRRMAQVKEPAIIKELKKENNELLQAKEEITKERDLLQSKLAIGIDDNTGLDFLALFKKSAGRMDKTNSPEMRLEDIEIINHKDETDLSFKIVNETKENDRLTGYLFVLMQHKGQISFWPETGLAGGTMQAAFTNGEYFATSRFRPVKADFKIPTGSDVLFKVIVFSRSGDLIFKQFITKTN